MSGDFQTLANPSLELAQDYTFQLHPLGPLKLILELTSYQL